jgi:hypothetical protein
VLPVRRRSKRDLIDAPYLARALAPVVVYMSLLVIAISDMSQPSSRATLHKAAASIDWYC